MGYARVFTLEAVVLKPMKDPLPTEKGKGAWPGEEMEVRSPEVSATVIFVKPSIEDTSRSCCALHSEAAQRIRRNNKGILRV